jgi:DNA primase
MSRFFFSQEKIEEVREAAEIIEIIGEYIPLKKAGKNYSGLCPFHSEKKPSFTVSPTKQLYHCFGCGASGNVITFIMKYNSVSFVEAIEILAKKYGISIEKKSLKGEDKLKQDILRTNEFAFTFFRENLFSESGKRALLYLKKRGIKESTIKDFGLGYAQDGWDHLLRAARKAKINDNVLVSSGLVVKNEKGRLYDRFRKRIIFPFFNTIGKKIGFAGRILGDEMPKYLNISESPLYRKRYTLYGLYQSREDIRKANKCLFVEGYMDLISLYQTGFRNVVAISGTSLTDEQAQYIRKYTRNVYVSFDADRSGRDATIRGISIFIKNGLTPYIMTLKGGKDPDEVVTNEGIDAFQSIIDNAEHYIDFKLRLLCEKYDIKKVDEKAEVVREMSKTVTNVRDITERQMWLSKLSKVLSIDESLLLGYKKKASQIDQFSPSVLSLPEICHDLAVMVAMNPERFEEVIGLFREEDLFDETSQRIVHYIEEKKGKGEETFIADVIDLIDDSVEKERVSSIVFKINEDIRDDDLEKMIDQYIKKVRTAKLRERWNVIKEEIKRKKGDQEAIRTLLHEQNRIAMVLKKLGGNIGREKRV